LTAGTALAAGLSYFGLFGHMELRVSGPFSVLPIENSDARAAVEGIIDKIYVDEGDEVRAGQLIARLSDKDLRADLGKTEAEIRAAAAKLRMLEAGPTKYQIEVAKAAVAKADDRLKYAQNRETRFKGLFDEHLRSRNAYEDSKELAAAAENELAEAKSRLDLLLSGNRPEEIEATRAEIDRLETERRYLREQLRLLNVLSPSTGIVATPSRQLKEMRHMLVKKGDLILKVYDFKTVTAQILVPEKNIDGIRVGQSVVLRARSYPSEEFHGTVTSIAISAQGSSGSTVQTPFTTASSSNSAGLNKTILITTEIKNPDMLLKSEMTGYAKISCGQRRVIDLIVRRIGRTLKVEFWSLW
jgi:multidrug resistance efflux pump